MPPEHVLLKPANLAVVSKRNHEGEEVDADDDDADDEEDDDEEDEDTGRTRRLPGTPTSLPGGDAPTAS